ncbi:hypothetical protein D3C78_980130 [compost metagenome]
MRADVFIGQRCQRTVEIICCIMDHQHFNAWVGSLRLMAGIQLIRPFIDDALFTRTSRQQQRQQGKGQQTFHRRVFTAVPLTLTISMLASLPTVS